jgi:hypothetical protein
MDENNYQTTRCHILEESNLHNHRHENKKNLTSRDKSVKIIRFCPSVNFLNHCSLETELISEM